MPINNSKERKWARKQRLALRTIEINESGTTYVEREHNRGFHKNCNHDSIDILEEVLEGNWDHF
jgi:hypothetical protein